MIPKQRQLYLTIPLLLILSGCSPLKQMDQILTLKDLADEQEILDQHVDAQELVFQTLVKDVQSGTIAEYEEKGRIQEKFGEPILMKKVSRGGENVEMWMYRRPVNYFDSDEVFLYFDAEAKLVTYEYKQRK